MERRTFLNWITAAGAAALAGCNTPESTETEEETVDPLETNFQYHFTDAEGFNQVGGDIPENADEHQVVESFIQTSDKVDTWTEMLTNDHNKTRLALDEHRVPNPGKNKHLEGTVEEIVEKTEELFNDWPENAEEFEEDYGSDIAGISVNQIEEIEDKAEKFTMALRGASALVTGHNNSAAANYLNTNLAEYTLQQLDDVEIPGYKVSTLWTAIDTIYEEKETPAEFDHPIGFLQYQDEEGNQKARHFEFENSEWRSTYGHSANLENSVYAAPLDKEYTDAAASMPTPEFESNNFLSPLDYERGRELERRGELSESFDKFMIGALKQVVDDAPQFYDYSEEVKSGADSKAGIAKSVVSNSFGQSVEEYANNPSVEGYDNLIGTSRAIFSAMAKQGWNEPIAIDGTIEDLEIYHATEETIEDIHKDRAYDQIKQRVMAG